MELNIGWPETFVRLWIPNSRVGWKYCLQNPRSFVIGVYGFQRWEETNQALMRMSAEKQELERKLTLKNQKMAEIGKELSKLKRSK